MINPCPNKSATFEAIESVEMQIKLVEECVKLLKSFGKYTTPEGPEPNCGLIVLNKEDLSKSSSAREANQRWANTSK